MKGVPAIWRGAVVKPALSDLKRFRDQPHRFLLELARAHGDVVWYGAGPAKFVLGARPEHVNHVLVEGQRVYTKDTFQYGFLSNVTGDGLLTSDGEKWRERRRIQQPAFHRKRLELVARATRRATADMLARWQATDSGRVDIADEMFRLSLDVVMDVLFGYDIGDEAPEIVGATLGVLHYLIKRSRSVPGIPSWMYPRSHVTFKRSLAVLDGVIARVLAERRRERASRSDAGSESETLLDLLIEAEGEARITAIGVRNEMMTMIIAGHETVASALTWAWRLVGDDAHVAQRLRDEGRALLASADSGEGGVESISHLGFARNVLSEAMRLYPPAWIVSRKSEPESNVRPDRWLPRGTLVMLSPYVTQRLQSYWPDPDRFDPTRFEGAVAPGTWFPYGAGQRLCIGKDFALVEATIVLSDVSRRYRLKPLSSSSRDYAGVTLQPEGGLDVELSAA